MIDEEAPLFTCTRLIKEELRIWPERTRLKRDPPCTGMVAEEKSSSASLTSRTLR